MKYNLPKLNMWLIAASFVVIVIGFVLMAGQPSGATEYNPDIPAAKDFMLNVDKALYISKESGRNKVVII